MENFSRRTFLKSASVVTAGTLLIPNLFSCSANNKLNIAIIGVGGRGEDNWKKLFSDENGDSKQKKDGQIRKILRENVVALCDVDEKRAAYGFEVFPKAKKYKDFRVMFDEMANQIDAVIISTPDHSHFAATMIAMQLGKHVYVEKPLAHNIWQLRTMKKAAKYYRIVSQMGNQGHTTNGIRKIREWYDAGVLGQVKEVHAWFGPYDFQPGGYWTKPDGFPPSAQPVPAGLNWDLWLGQTTERPFNSAYCPKSWRGFYDFGNGLLGDWSCHTLDAPFWALDLGMPHTIEATVPNPVPDRSFIPDESVISYQFGVRGDKAPVNLVWHEGGSKPEIRPEWGVDKLPGSGMMMIGEKKTLITGGRPNEPRLMVSEEEWQEFLKNPPAQTFKRIGEEQPQQEWIDCIKNNTLPGSNFEYSADLSEMALIGVLAQKFAAKIEYDASNMKITNRQDIDEFINVPARNGWSYGGNMWK